MLFSMDKLHQAVGVMGRVYLCFKPADPTAAPTSTSVQLPNPSLSSVPTDHLSSLWA